MRTFLLAILLLAAPLPAFAQALYWVETAFPAPLYRTAAANGSGATAIPLGPQTLPEGVAFDAMNGHVYWVEASWSGARIQRANADGSGAIAPVRGGSSFRGLALDVPAGKLYWTSSHQGEGGKIRRANLDGSNAEVVLDLGPAANPRGIALDPSAGKMYWADVALGQVSRANLDGTAAQTFATITAPYGVAVDPVGGFVYFTSVALGSLSRVPIAGGTIGKVKGSLEWPTYLALDPPSNTVYWIDGQDGASRLRRGPMTSGGTIEDLLTLSSFGGLALGPGAGVDVPPVEPATSFALGAMTPNPASGTARVSYALPQASRVRIEVIDTRGRRVATLVDGELPSGRHEAVWNGRGDAGPVAPGLYFLRLLAPGVELVRRAVRLP